LQTFGDESLNVGGGVFVPGRASAWEVDTSSGPGAVGGGCGNPLPTPPPSGLPAGLVVLARAENPADPGASGGEVVYYDHPAGGKVLSFGSITAGGSLVLDPVMQRMVRNLLGPPSVPIVPVSTPIGLVTFGVAALSFAARALRRLRRAETGRGVNR
ncbi:hypothetical protein K2X89_06395, partial [Myxococcota bacterium]|nr:hypothetical protein [Myxococcota bacterium]